MCSVPGLAKIHPMLPFTSTNSALINRVNFNADQVVGVNKLQGVKGDWDDYMSEPMSCGKEGGNVIELKF